MTRYEFGNFIADHRKRCGMKQKELAKKVGIREHYLSNIECGEAVPRLEIVNKILENIGCEIQLTEKEGFIYQEDYI